MNDEDMIIARDLLHTVIDFIENGKVDSLVEEEIMNYFRMCHQVEIYYEKFAMKGFYIRVEHGTGNFSLNVTPDESPGSYDFGRLADKFFELFCRPSVPSSILARATRAYRREIGNERLALCVQSFANLKKVFNIGRVCTQVGDESFLLEAAFFVESYMAISAKHNGMVRVDLLLKELIVEDECAETVISILAVEYEMDVKRLFEIKTMLFNHLTRKYKESPSDRMWITMLKCPYLIAAINSFEPFLDFILKIVTDVAVTLQFRPTTAGYGVETVKYQYDDLVNLMIRLYRNPNSMQKSMLFMFNMFQTDAAVWANIISACHNKPAIEDN
ncbi:unnamed protein product, partial [Nesidiocoris tenuis]